MQIKKRVEELFVKEKYYCAETVLRILLEAGGKYERGSLRMATGMCSGMARTKGVCGALTGGIMGLGFYAGRDKGGDDIEFLYAMVQELREGFAKRFGSDNCFCLTGCDLMTAEGQNKFADEKKVNECIDFTVFAVESALKILQKNSFV